MRELRHMLKDRRKENKWSQKFLGELAGVSQQYIGLIEKGKVSPNLKVIEKLADALDCELRLLLK